MRAGKDGVGRTDLDAGGGAKEADSATGQLVSRRIQSGRIRTGEAVGVAEDERGIG